MIFVTVGTHEQQFNRLIREVDRLKKANIIEEDVFIQRGYSDYVPQYCAWEKMMDYENMQAKINAARLVITHGGPASLMEVMATGKIPIVVPRQHGYNEHVDDHQVDFCRFILTQGYNISLVEDITQLESLLNQDLKSGVIKSNNKKFNHELKKMIDSFEEVR